MAATCGVPQPTFPKIHTFPSHLSSRGFILPALSLHRFPTLATAAAAVTMAGPLRPPVDSLAAMLNPALMHANILFFSSGYNVQIVVEENEAEEALLRRFRREVSKAGIILECRRRRFFENKQEERKRKKREASRRNRRRRFSGPRVRPSSSKEENSVTKKAGNDSDDNWEYFDANFP